MIQRISYSILLLLLLLFQEHNSLAANSTTSPTQAQQNSSPPPLQNEGYNFDDPNAPPTNKHEFPPINSQYTILREEVRDMTGERPATQVDLYILQTAEMSHEQLTTLLNQIYNSVKSRVGILSHKHPEDINILTFLSADDYISGLRTKWVAGLTYRYSEKQGDDPSEKGTTFEISFNDGKFRRTEAQRRAIWEQEVLAEDRANNECYKQEKEAAKYGDVPKSGQPSLWEICQRLLKEAREQVAHQHGLTYQELQAINNEATEKNWPIPPEEK